MAMNMESPGIGSVICVICLGLATPSQPQQSYINNNHIMTSFMSRLWGTNLMENPSLTSSRTCFLLLEVL